MKNIVNLARLDRPENLKIGHTIELGTLVEVDISYSEHHGIRGFVCEHTRDCDGTPLYALYFSNDFSCLEYMKKDMPLAYRFSTVDGFSADSLIIIKAPEKKDI